MEIREDIRSDSENLLAAHAFFQEDFASLSGKWRLLRLSQEEPLPDGWLNAEFNDRKWEKVTLPCRSFDTSTAGTVTGLYRRSFTLSREPGSRRIVFRFDCPPTFVQLWINSSYVGTAAGIAGAAEFDITNVIRPDKNLVCLRVCCAEGADPIIPGDLGLYSLPGRCITDIQTAPIPGAEPLVQVRVTARSAEGFTARIALLEENRVISYREAPIEDDMATVLLSCNGLKMWNAESPALYRIAVILWDGIANYHTRERTVGIRNAQIQDGVLFVNGVPEKLFAAEYSVRSRESGEFYSQQQMESELRALREHHINTIIVKEFPSDALLSLCDRIGLYVLEQTGYAGEDTSEAAARLYTARAGHPCLLGWDLESVEASIIHLEKSMLAPEVPLSQVAKQLRQSHEHSIAVIPFSGPASLREVKAALAPIVSHYQDGILTIENHSRFRSTGEYDGSYSLTRDGVEILSKPLELDIPPCSQGQLPLETRYDIYKPGRYHLCVKFCEKDSTAVIAQDQWEVGALRHIYEENPGGTIREETGRILLRSQQMSYIINRSTGCPEQIEVDGHSLLVSPLLPVFSEEIAGLHLPDEWERFSARWRSPKPAVLEVDQMTRTVTASFRLGSGLIQTYRLFADGSLSVDLRLRTGKTAPDRIGWRCAVSPRISDCHWFGLGPDFSDESHRLGRYFGIHTMHPEDAAMRDQVYKLALTDGHETGFRVRSEEALRFSLEQGKDGNILTMELSPDSPFKPHTTYTFSITLCPIP